MSGIEEILTITGLEKGFLLRIIRLLEQVPEHSLAVFDADGTVWSDDVGIDFYKYIITNELVSKNKIEQAKIMDKKYSDHKIDATEWYCSQTSILSETTEKQVCKMAEQYFNSFYKSKIFKPVQQMINI